MRGAWPVGEGFVMGSKSIHGGEVVAVAACEVREERLVEEGGSLKEEGGIAVGGGPECELSEAVEVKRGMRDGD